MGIRLTYDFISIAGPGDFVAHVHEGLELADASGFIAVSFSLAF